MSVVVAPDAERATEPGAEPARPPLRLRDLRGTSRMCVIVVFACVVVTFAIALERALRVHWIPQGDEANIATRSLDVLSRHPPLTGLPSTSGLYAGEVSANHPGPIEFYLIAVPLRLLGQTAGPLLTATIINATWVLVSLWAVFRRAGVLVFTWAGVLALGVIWSGGTAVMTDTLSSNMTMYSLLATAVLAWVVADGDIRMLPWAAFAATYAAQQHLAAGIVVAAMAGAAAVVLLYRFVVHRRHGERIAVPGAARWSLVALALVAVCWTPVLLDQVRTDPGNLQVIVDFARNDDRPTLGLDNGIDQALAVGPPTILTRTDTTGGYLGHRKTTARRLGGVVCIAALVAIAIAARRRQPALARLSVMSLALLAAGVINGASVPRGVESWRVNLYRWHWAAAFMTWLALGWAVGLGIGALVARSRARDRSVRAVFAPVTLAMVSVAVTAAVVLVTGLDDRKRNDNLFPVERHLARETLEHVDRRQPVLVVYHGSAAELAIGPHITFRLIEAGMNVRLRAAHVEALGGHRQYRPGTPTQTVTVSSGAVPEPPGPGAVIARGRWDVRKSLTLYRALRSQVLTDLMSQIRGQRVELAPNVDDIVRRRFPGQDVDAAAMARLLERDPRRALSDARFVELARAGAFRSPDLDMEALRNLVDVENELRAATHSYYVVVRLLPA